MVQLFQRSRMMSSAFRNSNSQADLPRLKQFLRDIDKGVWTFCTSYNNMNAVIPQENDPIAKHFLPLDPLPWVEVEEKTWAQVGFRDKSLVVGLSVRSQRRPWCREPLEAGKPGHFYDFHMFAQDGRTFDLAYLLEQTHSRHHHLVYLCLDDMDHSVRFTVPAILGDACFVAPDNKQGAGRKRRIGDHDAGAHLGRMLAENANLEIDLGIPNDDVRTEGARVLLDIYAGIMPTLRQREEERIQQSKLSLADRVIEFRLIPSAFRRLFAQALLAPHNARKGGMIARQVFWHCHLAEKLRFPLPQLLKVFGHFGRCKRTA